jgi:hypothetical protein
MLGKDMAINPNALSHATCLDLMQRMKTAFVHLIYLDYVLIIFSSHGYHCTNRESTVLDVRDGHAIDSVELRDGAKKQTLILDCCRQKYLVKPGMMMDSARIAKNAPLFNPADTTTRGSRSAQMGWW